ncbi:MAG TPA: YgeY family selenium metabolism-linked hydrolase [Caldithrix abyssi]|uniref:YgeY family selenium metabolism-linked hydrolase n=1 Tax=Caldithrix abyssi TaxID=187145 RepID=A0A7V4WV88_CALAY|nr:YgeY family selenium metabolism-linked hydrolase [Caldithrix abyssi]
MDAKLKEQIRQLAEQNTRACADYLRELIAIPSTSCNEKEVVQRIKREMESIGYDEITIDPMGNILGRIGNGNKIIAFDAHVDTVDVGNPELWDFDPFEGKEENGIIYGRGASDMKAGMAAITYAGKLLKEIGIPDDVTVYVVGSVQEEDCDGLCWQYIVKEDRLRPDLVVITEPTNLNIYRGHRGRMEIEVETVGLSCHGSAPERGVNAIYKMAPIIQDIEKLNERLRHDDFLGKGTVTISHIRSTSPSLCAVADSATIHLDRRLTAGETEETALDEIRSLPSFQNNEARVRVLEYDTPSYTGLRYPTKKYYPTWKFEEDHPAVRAAVQAYRQMFEDQPKIDKWTFSTNGVATAGMFGIPTIGFGPANEVYAHSPQDQCPVEHLTKAMMFYAAIARMF